MDDLLAGDDGAESYSSPPPPPTKNAIDDKAIREMIRSFHQNSLPEVPKAPEPVRQTGKGKQKKK